MASSTFGTASSASSDADAAEWGGSRGPKLCLPSHLNERTPVTFAVSLTQLALAAVFALAGVAKLADLSATRQAMVDFGLGPRWAAVGARLLPIAELAVAVALIPAATARWGAVAAIALLAVFSVAIARTLRAGTAPDCNCFGGLTQTEVGRGTLVRNLALAALAAFVVASGETVGAFRWVTVPAAGDRAGFVILIACLVGLGAFCWALLRQNGRLLLRLDALDGEGGASAAGSKTLPPLQPGTPAPEFAGVDLQGQAVSLRSLLSGGHPVALFFTDPGCGACESALDAVSRAQRERADELTIAVISSGSIDRIEEKATKFGLARVVPQGDDSLFDAYRVNGVPGIVEIGANGDVTRPAELGADAVRDLVLGTATEPAHERIGLVTR